METTVQPHINPLINFMRQPKIYIRLPSGGEYWPQGALMPTETGEYPIYSMTARDELMLKIPDALMNGQAVVDVIQNCMPNVKNAWAIPAIDLDVILIAIRIATYGEKMTTPLTFGDDLEMEHSIDLRSVMDTLMNQITWEPVVPINNDLTVYVKPITYKQLTESAIQTFETQKIMQVANDNSMSDENKVTVFKESFAKLTAVTIGMIGASIYKVDSSQGSTDNPKFIKEFIDNADKDIFNRVQDHLEKLKEVNSIKPIVIQVTEEMRAAGVTEDTIEVPLVFDASTFFE
jgi:hypothetical protein